MRARCEPKMGTGPSTLEHTGTLPRKKLPREQNPTLVCVWRPPDAEDVGLCYHYCRLYAQGNEAVLQFALNIARLDVARVVGPFRERLYARDSSGKRVFKYMLQEWRRFRTFLQMREGALWHDKSEALAMHSLRHASEAQAKAQSAAKARAYALEQVERDRQYRELRAFVVRTLPKTLLEMLHEREKAVEAHVWAHDFG